MNIKILFFIVENIIKGYLKKPLLFIISLLAPTFFGLLLLGLVSGANDKFPPIGFVSENETLIIQMVKDAASMDGKIKMTYLQRDNWENSLKEKKVNAVVIIPKDFEEKVIPGNSEKIQVVSIAGDQTGKWIEANIKELMVNIHDFALLTNRDKEAFYKLLNDYKATPKDIIVTSTDDISDKRQKEIGGIGMLSWIIFITCALYTIRIISERENNTLRRISATRANGKIFVAANIIAAVFLAILQVSVATLNLYYVFGLLKYIPILGFFALLLTFAIVAISFGTLTAAINKTSVNNILMIVMGSSILSMIGGVYWPIEITPVLMQRISFFTPQGWLINAFNILKNGSGVVSIVPHVLAMLAFAVTFIIAASYALSRQSSKGI